MPLTESLKLPEKNERHKPKWVTMFTTPRRVLTAAFSKLEANIYDGLLFVVIISNFIHSIVYNQITWDSFILGPLLLIASLFCHYFKSEKICKK